MFVCVLTDQREVDTSAPSYQGHRERVEKNLAESRWLCGGPTVAKKGAVVIAYGDDEQEARAILDADPLIANGTLTYELIQFSLALADPASSLAARL